jgi:hypothetical protein
MANAIVPINQSSIMDVGETNIHMHVAPIMVWRSLSAFVVMTFGESNATFQSLKLNFQHCKKTLNIITKPKSFQNKQIMVFLLHVMLVIGLQPKVHQLSQISFGFVMMTLIVVWEGQARNMHLIS